MYDPCKTRLTPYPHRDADLIHWHEACMH